MYCPASNSRIFATDNTSSSCSSLIFPNRRNNYRATSWWFLCCSFICGVECMRQYVYSGFLFKLLYLLLYLFWYCLTYVTSYLFLYLFLFYFLFVFSHIGDVGRVEGASSERGGKLCAPQGQSCLTRRSRQTPKRHYRLSGTLYFTFLLLIFYFIFLLFSINLFNLILS